MTTMTRTVLITGGAGYVGSHSLLHFRSLGWRVVVLDDFSAGHREFAGHADRVIEGTLLDQGFVNEALSSEAFDGVLHCAGKIQVGESVERPTHYLRENILSAINLVDALREKKTPLVFSSTAAVYGTPEVVPIPETAKRSPDNPYGLSKLVVEQLLEASGIAHGLPWMALRYFNAAGADRDLRVGEDHHPETHLIPNIFRAALSSAAMKIFGDDYDTRDGTCLRDYVHVDDVALAHAAALRHLWDGGGSESMNLGSGSGFTVREVLDAARRVTGREIRYDMAPRRPGDSSALVADTTQARSALGWKPESSELDHILTTAWRWHQHRFGGDD